MTHGKEWRQSKAANPDPDIVRNYFIDTNGKKIYRTEESRKLAEIRLASNQSFREGEGIYDSNTEISTITNNINNGEEEILPREVTESNNILNKGMKDADMPLMFKIACRDLEPLSTINNNKKDMNVLTETEIK